MKYRQCSWPTNELKHVTCDRCITYSLDCDNGIEKAVVQHPLTPEEILEDKQLRDQLYAAVMELPDKQAKWIYARFYLGMTIKEIAKVEGVDLSWIYKSIKRGLKRLRKKVQKV